MAGSMQPKEECSLLLATLPVPVLVLDPDANIIQANDAAQELLTSFAGSEEWCEPMRVTPQFRKWLRDEVIAASQAPGILQSVRTLGAGAEVRTFEVRSRCLAGDTGGRPMCSVVLTEITSPKPECTATTECERGAREILDHLPSIVWSVDKDLRFTACGGGLLRAVGSTPDRAIGRLLTETFGPNGADAATVAAHRRALDGETVTYECRWNDRHFHSLVAPLVGDDNEIAGAIGVGLDITERVRDVEEIRRSRDQAECLIQTANVLIIGLDIDGRVTVFNEAAERSTGYHACDLSGCTWFDLLVPPSERQSVRNTFDYLLKSEGRTEFTSPVITRYGQRRLVTWRSSVIRDGGEPVGILSIGQDVTDLMATQERLRDSEERHRTVLASLPQRIFVKDQQGVFVSVNEPFARDFGLRPRDLVGRSDFDFFDPQLAEKYRADDRRVMETRATETIIEANVVHDRQRYVEVVKAPVVTADGSVIGVVGVFTDITDRKRMEEELAHERDLLHTLMTNIPDQIYFKDRESRFTRINPGAAAAIGCSNPDDAVGRNDFDVHPEELAAEYHADEQRLMQSGEPLIGKLEVQRGGTNKERWMSTTKVPIRDRSGKIVGIAGISRDVSDRIEVEDTLRRTAAELARSNEELQQFAYVASHDLQEPLRMVASYTQLLARRYRDKLDDDGLEFINYAVDGATRMQRLIQDLLAYSRVGTRGDAFEPVPLSRALERALANLKVALEEAGAVITNDPLPTLHGDLSQLAQLFQNLIGNAIKFRREESPRVHISAQRQGGDWLISVSDNGIGIEAEYAERIFVIFQRLHGKAEYPGSGIGLSICKKIVARHGGSIWVEGRLGEGSTFHMKFPGGGGKPDRTMCIDKP